MARTVAALAAYGVEARHLRAVRAAAERETSLIEQVIAPTLRQRNAAARENAGRTARQIAALSLRLHRALIEAALAEAGLPDTSLPDTGLPWPGQAGTRPPCRPGAPPARPPGKEPPDAAEPGTGQRPTAPPVTTSAARGSAARPPAAAGAGAAATAGPARDATVAVAGDGRPGAAPGRMHMPSGQPAPGRGRVSGGSRCTLTKGAPLSRVQK